MRILCLAVILCSCGKQSNKCNFTVPTTGTDRNALIDRVYLNQEYYFSNEPFANREDIYVRPELGRLKRGQQRQCVDSAMTRSVFQINVKSMESTSATVEISSSAPSVFNWFGSWHGTVEVWNVNNGSWKLTESLTEVNANSEFIQTYFSD